MKFPDTKVREHVGNVAAGRAAILDEASIKYIFGYLSDLYSDRALAFIRETATNAWDSHVEAGVTRPIEVTLPTDLSPNYVIRDYGVGLSPEGVYKTFGIYAYSTKRDSDEFNGMLGLGSKSIITYVDQFTVTAVKDGVRSESLITRGEDGVLHVLTPEQGVSQTQEPNGVTISIPVPTHKHHEVRDRAERFFSFWAPGTVLVNGEEPARAEVLVELDPQVFLVDDDEGEDRIIMGNVAYPLSYGASRDLRNYVERRTGMRIRSQIHAYVPTGEVMFTPSRESLDYTDLTNGTLRLLAEFVADSLERKAESSIAAAKSLPEAFKASQNLSKAFTKSAAGRFSLRWNGRRVPGGDEPLFHANAYVSLDDYDNVVASYKHAATRVSPRVVLGASDAYVIQSVSRLAGKKRQTVQQFLDNGSHKGVYLIDAANRAVAEEWLAHNDTAARVYTWEEAEEIAGPLPVVTTDGGGRETTPDDLTEYDRVVDGYKRVYYRQSESYLPTRTTTVAALRESGRALCYVTPSNDNNVPVDVLRVMEAAGWTILRIPGNRTDKAKRLLDGLVTLGDAATQVAKEAAAKAPWISADLPALPDIDPADVLDPDVESLYADVAEVADRVVAGKHTRAVLNTLRYVRNGGWDESSANAKDVTKVVERLAERRETLRHTYPALFRPERYGSTYEVAMNGDAAIEYINALYFYRTEFNVSTDTEETAA